MSNHLASLETDHDHQTLRCMVDERGQLVYVSPALGWMIGRDAVHLTQTPAAAVFGLATGEGADMAALPSGFHEAVIYRQQRDPVMIQARVDRVDLPGGRSYRVFWFDPESQMRGHGLLDSHEKDFGRIAQELAETLDYQRTAQGAVAPGGVDGARKTGEISKDDSELRHFLNLTNDLIAVYSREGRFVRVNPAFNRVLGFSDNELRPVPFIGLVHPDDRARAAVQMEKILRTDPGAEARVDFHSRIISKDGTCHWIEWIHKAVGGYIYIVGRDVTDLKLHELELERREQQLREAQKIGRMGHWYWVTGDEDIEWSDQIYTIFGVEKGVFRPTMESINGLLLKRDVGRILYAFQHAIEVRQDYQLQFRLRHPSGGVRYIRCEGKCEIDDKTGKVTALFGIMQDITERTLHERALREAKEAAESAYASRTRFLANMSHELRTPLNAIIGFSQMIQQQLLGPVGNKKYLDYIGGIRESGEHLLSLINDILDMSKIEIGKYEIQGEEINLGKLIRLVLHMMEGRAHEGQVRLICDDIAEDIQIMADRRALMQIMLNLMSNAVKFTDENGTVEVRCGKTPGGAFITVRDTGIGIPEDKIHTVTMPFEQVDSELTRKHEGTGLGLAITKELVELHGGALEIDSVVGVGTTVTVLLPEKLAPAKTCDGARVPQSFSQQAR